MAKRFLDSKISTNASTTGAISVPLTSTPTLFATLGLNAINAGPNLEVQFTVTSEVNLLTTSTITITVQRVVAGVPTTIYSSTVDLQIVSTTTSNSRNLITFNGVDNNPPATFLVYQALISSPELPGLAPIRVGPESMIAAAYSD